ncbi:MAG: carbohydrate-binding domain-containing protein, partial [Lachnospiraceae bacterium]|nr:carbohydrate-binding domain-containing protein [Lachnospiraceae bacterium]
MRKGKEWNLKRLSAVAMAAVFALAQPMGVLAAEEAQAAVNEGEESLITTADHGEETLVEKTGAENTEDLLSSTGSDAETLVFAQTSVITGEDLDGVSVDDTDAAVKVTISQNGAYTLSGTWKNTYISIEKSLKDGVELVLNDVTIDNTDLNSILGEDVPVIECGKKSPLTITLNGENEITGSSTYTTEPEALIAVKKDGTIDIQGSGSLTLTDPMSDDTVEAAADAGLDPADGIKVGYGTAGGTFNMVSGTLTVDVQGDAIKAKNGNINILGGTVNTVTNGDGIKAKLDLEGEAEGSTGTGTVTIKDGTVNITSYGDGIQAENIDIQGGMVDITTLFDNASTGYYTSGSSYKSGYNTLYESSSSKIEYVAVDTGSHTGLKAGTKAKTAIYGYDITT